MRWKMTAAYGDCDQDLTTLLAREPDASWKLVTHDDTPAKQVSVEGNKEHNRSHQAGTMIAEELR